MGFNGRYTFPLPTGPFVAVSGLNFTKTVICLNDPLLDWGEWELRGYSGLLMDRTVDPNPDKFHEKNPNFWSRKISNLRKLQEELISMENKILSWYYGNDFWAVKLSLSFFYQTYTSHLIEHVCCFFFFAFENRYKEVKKWAEVAVTESKI